MPHGYRPGDMVDHLVKTSSSSGWCGRFTVIANDKVNEKIHFRDGGTGTSDSHPCVRHTRLYDAICAIDYHASMQQAHSDMELTMAYLRQ